jgi:hypothetical protein
MWFEKRSKPVSENALEHWSTERMILEGHADYATAEDLEGLDDSLLLDISKICEMDVMSPDECIPCMALAMHLDRQRERLENLAPKDEHLDPNLGDAGEIDFKPETPKLDALMDEAPVFTEPEVKDTASQFADKVAELQDLVTDPSPQRHGGRSRAARGGCRPVDQDDRGSGSRTVTQSAGGA